MNAFDKNAALTPAQAAQHNAFPAQRLRRNRVDAFTRRLVAENRLSIDDLIWPIFVIEGTGTETPVASMPGVKRVTLDRLAAHVEPAAKLGIPALALFPATPADKKDAEGTEAKNPENLMCRAARIAATRPSIMSDGAITSIPASAWITDWMARISSVSSFAT